MDWIRTAMAVVAVGAIASCKDKGSGGAGEIEFSAEEAFLPGFSHDTGFLPASSPVAIRASAVAEGTIAIVARATTDGASLDPVAGSGALTTGGEFSFEISAKIDTAGIAYEGVVDTFAYLIEPTTTMFDPFLLEGEAVVDADLPAAELARVPIPSVPGATLIVDVTGGTLSTTFRGTCAEAAEGVGRYTGQTTIGGTIELSGTVEIEIPIVGTETFGPFALPVAIPESMQDVDLGGRSLGTGDPVEGSGACEPGSASATDSGDSVGTSAGTDDSGDADSASTTTTTTTTSETSTTGPDTDATSGDDTGDMCDDVDAEPNDSEATAVAIPRTPPYACGGLPVTLQGTLDGPDDDDWFVFPSADTEFGGCNHRFTVDTMGARVCLFPSCAQGVMPAMMCIQGTPEPSPDGVPGCCTGLADGVLQIECEPGAGTLIDAYVRVDRGMVCDDYEMVYQQVVP